MSKRIAILQSNFLPWRGYFDMIAKVDEFVIYDDVQYTKEDWRNRNKIKTRDGLKWINVPVKTKGNFGQKINQAKIADPMWFKKVWGSIENSYRKSISFDTFGKEFKECLFELEGEEFLSAINYRLISFLCKELGVNTLISNTNDMNLVEDRVERLVQICKLKKADTYLTGESAKVYLSESLFRSEGIDVEWMTYEYKDKEYNQLHSEYEPFVSVVDLLMNTDKTERRELFNYL